MPKRLLGAALTVVLGLPAAASGDMSVGTWNLEHLGWDNGKRIDLVAHIAQGADLWALTEVMDEAAVSQLESELESLTGESWSSMTSHEVGRSSYQESYSYLWRDSQVEYTKGAVVYRDPGDEFAREPYLAEFRDVETGDKVAMAAVHIVYGDSRADRTPEIRQLAEIWDWMREVYPETPRIIAGDFNLAPDHDAWQMLRDEGAAPAITSGATTLSSTDGQYANLYDNLWFDQGILDNTGSDIVEFPDLLGLSHEKSRDIVSDHAPVYITVGGAEPEFTALEGVTVDQDAVPQCIDLNDASASRLDELPQVGPARAEDIISARPFESIDGLTRIDGLGPARVEDIESSGMVCNL
ncbi:helix-hairpin-helix domain-containing protein [Halomonas sp. I1]|uniref:helix-hairpin-helix domain-containing protein n=1 Tax=Halomonas sp. I1 TaxID=393536 RepID=UPI0028DE647F|nr:helix-hairpin-helix domain-containing protein [Halomonas sp. I1]MDT8895616.1 helix-hairpin-helix domain-containing protein [Halomonas sp. I1]